MLSEVDTDNQNPYYPWAYPRFASHDSRTHCPECGQTLVIAEECLTIDYSQPLAHEQDPVIRYKYCKHCREIELRLSITAREGCADYTLLVCTSFEKFEHLWQMMIA